MNITISRFARLAAGIGLSLSLCSCGGNSSSLSPRGGGFGGSVGPRRPTTTTATDAPSTPPAPSRIAFISTGDGRTDLWVMEADGSQPRALTNDEAVESTPCWFDSGNAVCFLATKEKQMEIARVALANMERRVLVEATDAKLSHLCTPRIGAALAYIATSEEGHVVTAVSAAGEKPHALVTLPKASRVDSLAWLGTGGALCLVVQTPKDAATDSTKEAAPPPSPVGAGIQLIDPTTGKARPLTADDRDHLVTPSPVGAAVAFLRGEALMVIDDASAKKIVPRRLAEHAEALPVAWSPNGRLLARWKDAKKRQVELLPLGQDEPQLLQLPAEAVVEGGLHWSADARRLGFLKRQQQDGAERNLLYVIDLTGGKPQRLTTALRDHRQVNWRS